MASVRRPLEAGYSIGAGPVGAFGVEAVLVDGPPELMKAHTPTPRATNTKAIAIHIRRERDAVGAAAVGKGVTSVAVGAEVGGSVAPLPRATTMPSIERISRSMCWRKSRPISTGAALMKASGLRPSGSCFSPGMVAPSTSTGSTGTPARNALSTSTRTGSDSSSMRCWPSGVAPAQRGPITATTMSLCASAVLMWVRKSMPNGMLSMSMNTKSSP
jgi:hypothetical protein